MCDEAIHITMLSNVINVIQQLQTKLFLRFPKSENWMHVATRSLFTNPVTNS